MKKRIISLLLALVMLFSCLSLNIFATEPANGESAAAASANGTLVSDTLDAHTSAEISAMLAKYAVTGAPYTLSDGTTGISTTNSGLTYENGRIVMKPGGTNQARIDLAGHTYLNGRFALNDTNYKNTLAFRGNSFVAQSTITFTDQIKGKGFQIVQISDYIARNKGNGYGGNPHITTTDAAYPTLLKINGSMELIANVATTGYSRTDKTIMKKIETGVEYTFAVVINPLYVDEVNEIYGSFDVYVNGEQVAKDLALFTKQQNDDEFTFNERIPYAREGQWKNIKDKVLLDNQPLYFFSETAPSAEELAQIMEACGITGNGAYAVALGATKKGVKDMTLGFARFALDNNNTSYTDVAYYIDNILGYYLADGVEYTDIAIHDLTSTHAHDFTKTNTEIITTCARCDGKKVESFVLDANADRVCDVCVGELPVGALMTPDELRASGIKYKVSTALNANATWSSQINANNANDNGMITLKTTEDGNSYISYGKFTTPTSNGAYAQVMTDAAGREAFLGTIDELKGKAYTIAFDVMHTGEVNFDFLLDLYSYTKVHGKTDENGIYTEITSTDAQNWQPIKMNKDGYISYKDGENSGWVLTTAQILPGEFANIVFYHNPAINTYSVYLNGKCIAANIRALNDGQIANMTWTATRDAFSKLPSYVAKLKDSYFNEDGLFVMDGKTNWTLGFARFPQFATHENKVIDGEKIILSEDLSTITIDGVEHEIDGYYYALNTNNTKIFVPISNRLNMFEHEVFGLDNVKVYYAGENVECAHDYILTHSHDIANGMNKVSYACKFCDKTVKADVPMTDFASLSGNGKIPTPTEIKDLADETVIATEFSAENPTGGLSFNGTSVVSVSDSNGNYYLKYVKGANSYMQVLALGSTDGRTATAQKYGTYRNKSFTFTHDLMLPESFSVSGTTRLYEIMSYTKSANDCTAIDTVVSFNPLYIDVNNRLCYPVYIKGTNSVSSYVPVKTLTKGEWYTISLYFTPAVGTNGTYDIYINGEQVANDVAMLSDYNEGLMHWSSANLSYANIDYPDDAPVNKDGKKVFVVDGAKDFVPGIIRFPQLAPDKDMYCFDNVKMYFNKDYIECTHKYTNSLTCDWCGATTSVHHCDVCDGEALNADLAVVGKSVSLGELIDMNLYVKSANGKLGTVTLTAGDKTVEFDLAKLTAVNGAYKLSVALTSIDMAEDVTLTADVSYTTSIKEYAEQLITISADADEIALAKALLNYGAYAQIYFAEKNGNAALLDTLANAGLDEADRAAAVIPAEKLAEWAFTANGQTEDVKFTAMALTLSTKTYVKLYFTASENATVTVNGKNYTAFIDADGEYFITLTISTPDKAATDFAVVITDGDTVVSSNVSALNAVAAGVSSSNQKLADLLAAYAFYSKCAKDYIA